MARSRPYARFKGVSKFMNLKRAFEDAKLQHQRGMEKQGAADIAAGARSKYSQDQSTVRTGMATGRYNAEPLQNLREGAPASAATMASGGPPASVGGQVVAREDLSRAGGYGLSPRSAAGSPEIYSEGGYDFMTDAKGMPKKIGKSGEDKTKALNLIQMSLADEEYTLEDLVLMWPVDQDRNDPDFLMMLKRAIDRVPKRVKDLEKLGLTKEMLGL